MKTFFTYERKQKIENVIEKIRTVVGWFCVVLIFAIEAAVFLGIFALLYFCIKG